MPGTENIWTISRSLLLLVGTLAGCATTLPPYDYSKEPDPRTSEYVLGAGDSISVNVWHNADLSAEVPIRPDGTITLPLLGDMRAAGKTPSELRAEIERVVQVYVKEGTAVVSVAVSEVGSYRFSVVGEVASPGLFTSPTYVTVMGAIALAGGFTRFAHRGRLVLIRQTPGLPKRIPIDFGAITSGARPEMDLVMLPGDTLMVP